MNKTLICGLVAACATSALANPGDYKIQIRNTGAQQNIIQQGVKSLSASGSYFTTSGNHATNLSVSGSEFVTSNIEVRAGITYTSVNSSNSTGFMLGGRYYFDPTMDKDVLPFAGVFYSYNTGSGVNSSSFGGEVGVQYFLQPNISLTPEILYSTTRVSGVTNNTFGIQFGLTYWFK